MNADDYSPQLRSENTLRKNGAKETKEEGKNVSGPGLPVFSNGNHVNAQIF